MNAEGEVIVQMKCIVNPDGDVIQLPAFPEGRTSINLSAQKRQMAKLLATFQAGLQDVEAAMANPK